jgi:CRP-like cAMP-binding protein
LAAQCEQRVYPAKARLARAAESGSEMYVIQRGSVEVWNDPENYDTESRNLQHIASLRPGQITGELAMLDQGARSADLIAGSEGATVLVISRERFQALCQDDVMLGNQVLWNIATSMAHRVRFIIWQLHRAMKRESAD